MKAQWGFLVDQQLRLFGGNDQLRCLFFAVLPDSAAAARATNLSAQLRERGALSGRAVEPDRLHVSLHHLGDFYDQVPPYVTSTAATAAAGVTMEPFNIAFDRAGGTKGPFLLRTSDGAPVLQSFHRNLSAALARAGFRRRMRTGFMPHLTLSYSPHTAAERGVEPVSWTVRDFVLIESLHGKHQYILRGRWPAP